MSRSNFIKDALSAIVNIDQWLYTALWDIKSRYRRTVLGPMWLVIMTFISIACITVIGGMLFKVRGENFFAYIACSVIVWTFLSTLIIDGISVYLNYTWMLSNLKVNPLVLALRVFMRNFIIFLHGFGIVLLVLIWKGNFTLLGLLMIVPGILIFAVNSLCLSVTIGFFATRYRDFVQIVQALMNILFFMTPIMWRQEMLGNDQIIAIINPFTHFLDIIRFPLLGEPLHWYSIAYVAVFTVYNLLSAMYLYAHYKHRLVFWL